MDKLEFHQGNPQEEPPKRIAKKEYHIRWRYLAIGAAVILAVVACATLWDSTAFDGLRRSVVYSQAKKDENGCALLYNYASERDQSYTHLNGNLILVSQHHVAMLSESGQELYHADVKFHKSAVTDNGTSAAAYDIGGREIYLLNAKGLVRKLETDGEILGCYLNARGDLAVTAGKKGYKAAVSVYDSKGELRFEFKSSDRFLMTAAIQNDGSQMAAATMGETEGSFASTVVLYRMDSTEPLANCQLPGGAVYDIGVVGSNYCAVAEDGLFFIGKDGKQKAFFDFEGTFLRRCSLDGDGYATAVLGRYKSGGETQLVTVSENGELIGRVEMNGEVLSIDAAGKYVAVLCSDALTIYDKKLNVCAQLEDVSFARDVLMREDGSALLVGAESASLYLP